MKNHHSPTLSSLSNHVAEEAINRSSRQVGVASICPSDAVDDQSEVVTQPVPLYETPIERRLHDAMRVIERDYKRVHDLIASLWGRRGFGDYIRQLILSGDDGTTHNRAGFKQEAVAAMLVLSDLHDAHFGRSGFAGL